MSLVKQDIITKEQVDKALAKPKKELKFEAEGNKNYEFKAIIDNVVYIQQANDQIPSFYYLVL